MTDRVLRDMQIGDNVFGSVHYPNGGTHQQKQERFELITLHGGEMTITWESGAVTLQAKQCIMLRPGNAYRFEFRKGCDSWQTWLTFPESEVSVDLRLIFRDIEKSQTLSAKLEALLNIFMIYSRQPDETDEDLLISLANLALSQYAKELQGSVTGNDSIPQAVEQASMFIYDSLEQDIGLQRIASAVHLSPEHLVRLFKKAGYPSPIAYLWKLRTGRALSLIRNTGLSMNEIARQTGFKTPFHFSRKIKEAAGMSPTAIRRSR